MGGGGGGDGVVCLLRVCVLRVGVWETGFGIPLTCCEGASEPEVQLGNRGKQRCWISGRGLTGSNVTEDRILLSGVCTVPLGQGCGGKAALRLLLFPFPALCYLQLFQLTHTECTK